MPRQQSGPAEDLDRGRGRTAQAPSEIPRPGWRDILLRVAHRLSEDNATLVAGGIAFNAMFAVFPMLVVGVSIYGLFASPQNVADQLNQFSGMLPRSTARLLYTQLAAIAGRSDLTLGVGAIVSFAFTLYSSIQGMWALTMATNIAYHEAERRGYLHLLVLSLAFTVGALAGLAVMLALGLLAPLQINAMALGTVARLVGLALRWVLLWVFAVIGLAVMFRFAPCRQNPQWRWVTWGSIAAATLWLVASVLFALYVENFGSYGRTYGALGGAVVLLMWFYLGSFAVLLGAELNAEMEHQTAEDTTSGPPAPMGERGAFVADTLGPVPK